MTYLFVLERRRRSGAQSSNKCQSAFSQIANLSYRETERDVFGVVGPGSLWFPPTISTAQMDRLSKKIRKKLPKVFQQSVSPGQSGKIVAESSGFREDQGADPGDVPATHRHQTPESDLDLPVITDNGSNMGSRIIHQNEVLTPRTSGLADSGTGYRGERASECF